MDCIKRNPAVYLCVLCRVDVITSTPSLVKRFFSCVTHTQTTPCARAFKTCVTRLQFVTGARPSLSQSGACEAADDHCGAPAGGCRARWWACYSVQVACPPVRPQCAGTVICPDTMYHKR